MSIERLEDIYAYDECQTCGGLFNSSKMKTVDDKDFSFITHKLCLNCFALPAKPHKE